MKPVNQVLAPKKSMRWPTSVGKFRLLTWNFRSAPINKNESEFIPRLRELAKHWPRIGQVSTKCWPIIGRELIKDWKCLKTVKLGNSKSSGSVLMIWKSYYTKLMKEMTKNHRIFVNFYRKRYLLKCQISKRTVQTESYIENLCMYENKASKVIIATTGTKEFHVRKSWSSARCRELHIM